MLLTTTLGQNVVSKASAETLGSVDGAIVDVPSRKITALRLGKGRKAKLLDWSDISGIGTAAVIVENDDVPRDVAGDAEQRFVSGDVTLIGGLILSDRGNARGFVADIEYDDATGAIESIHTAKSASEATVGADRLRAVGSYAWIVAAAEDEVGGAL